MDARTGVRSVVAVSAVVLGTVGAGCVSSPLRTSAEAGVTTGIWAASPVPGAAKPGDPTCPAGPGAFTSGTIRNIVHPARDASRVRIRLSNEFGTAPLHVDAATVARQSSGPRIDARSLQTVTFGGRPGVVVPAGSDAVSDWATLAVTPRHNITVSFHVSGLQGPSTFHPLARQDNYVASGTTDHTAAVRGLPGGVRTRCWLFLTGVDAEMPSTVVGSVVAFGDSITDGRSSRINGNARWPDVLARRLAAVPGRTLSVVDEGIDGNHLLTGTTGLHGASGLSRFRRDVLAQPGVRTVILLEGVNDLGTLARSAAPSVSAASIVRGYEKLVALAHAHDVRVVGGTITPFGGAGYWTAQGEEIRQQVNRWILTGGAFDATVDFARTLADPDDPQRLRPSYDSGDHLHPDDAGYAALGRAVSLPSLLPPG